MAVTTSATRFEAFDAILAASVCVGRLAPPAPNTMARARPAISAALEAALPLPPLGLLADLQQLMSESAPTLSQIAVPGLSLRRYDDRVVGPLVTHRRRAALCDAYAGLPEKWRGTAVALLAEQLCESLEPESVHVASAAIRRVLAATDAEVFDLAVRSLSDREVLDPLSKRINGLCATGIADFTSADVHLVRNVHALATRSQRLYFRQVTDAATRLDSLLPRTVRPRLRAGPVSTGLSEEDTYPAGGFTALTTSGAPENLVASELVYMDDGDEIDLFDVRYTEGELLYYTRDESAHLRRRRAIHFGLSPDLVDARVKDAEVPWQRLVMVLGLLVTIVERAVRWLGEAELVLTIHPIGSGLEAETHTLSLLLTGLIEAGIVSIEPVADAAGVGAAAAASAEFAETDLVWITEALPPPSCSIQPYVVQTGRSLAQWSALGVGLAQHIG